MFINGINNPQNGLHIDGEGRAEAHSVGITEQSDSSLEGDAYNFNTSNFVLTSDVATPIFYVKNDAEDRDIVIPRVFVTFGASTGGSGDIEGVLYFNPTSGTIIDSGADKPPQNFNAGSSKTLQVVSKLGATGLTLVGGTDPVEFLFPGASSRHLVGFDSVVLPRGASMALTITPPSGNTSMKIQAGYNAYLSQGG